jgi:hypothetical protein
VVVGLEKQTRLLSVVVVSLTIVWLAGLTGAAVMASSDADERFSWLMMVLALTPGYALVPAVYYVARR